MRYKSFMLIGACSTPISAWPAEPSLQRSGERTLLVAEQLGRNQRLRDRGAIDANERATRSPGSTMNRTSDKLFARSGLTLDQNRGVGRRHFRDLSQHRP